MIGIKQFRQISTINKRKKLAVIGSGPSAFYTVLNILKKNAGNVEIDMFEQHPSPFGLVRYGVAPDHPEVKNCIDRFNDISEFITLGNFKYFGNVPVSKDSTKSLSLQELYDNYDDILYAYGSSLPNLPEVAGIEHPGIISSYEFVNWYNGHPNHQDYEIPLKEVTDVSIVGNGNVAIDIVRILLAPSDGYWSKTDISSKALATLAESRVKRVNVLARRGVLDSKFTNKELRELLEMDKLGVYFQGWNDSSFKEQLADVKLDRINKRRVSLLNKYNHREFSKEEVENGKFWNLQYLKSPVGFKVHNERLLSETIVAENQLLFKDGKWTIEQSGKIGAVKNQLVILATGYKCEPLKEFKELGIPFENGRIPNNNGKVENVDHSYCVGWVSNASRGNINSTVADSEVVADTILREWEKENEGDDEKKGRAVIEGILKERGMEPVDWERWNKIHQLEKLQGSVKGKPYEKLAFNDMLDRTSQDKTRQDSD